jgi:hypothetical protein
LLLDDDDETGPFDEDAASNAAVAGDDTISGILIAEGPCAKTAATSNRAVSIWSLVPTNTTFLGTPSGKS